MIFPLLPAPPELRGTAPMLLEHYHSINKMAAACFINISSTIKMKIYI
jgi:hypothetical protein